MKEKQQILAVDDEPRNLKILTLSLSSEWHLEFAATGEEALEKLKTFTPDLILLDIMMPGIDGYEVCKKIRENPKLHLTKVILVTGKALLEERLKGYDVGADDYMTKPFVTEELGAKVRVFMRLALMERKFRDLNASLEEQVRKRTEQLLDAESKLINSAKMSALGEMAGGIAHEINTPLATITLLSGQVQEILQEAEAENGSLLLKLTKGIEDTAARISKIIQGLRIFSRDGSKDPMEEKSLREVIESTLALCNEKFKNRQINLQVDPIPDVMLMCRPTQISQVLLNLFNNSYDAIGEQAKSWIKINCEYGDEFVVMRVTDSGLGIANDIQNKMFQPFFTTKDIGKGTGLGLSISKGLVEANGGRIYYDSSSPNTSFVLQFPVLKLSKVS
jgi:C4-dicarboxylate-specific signal transduction histidine kinase